MVLKRRLKLISLSVFLGFLIAFSPGFIFVLILTIYLLRLALIHTPRDSRKFILGTMLLALALRLISLSFIQIYCYPRTENVIYAKLDIFGDAQDNIFKGMHVSNVLREKARPNFVVNSILTREYNVHGKIFFNGIFFALFGNDIVPLKYINFLCIIISAWMIYDMTRRIYSLAAAKIAFAVIIFWPTLFVWSVTDLKDSHFIFSLVAIFWGINNFNYKKSLKSRLLCSLWIAVFSAYALSVRLQLLMPIFAISATILLFYFIFKYFILKGRLKVIKMAVLLVAAIAVFLRFQGQIQVSAINMYNTLKNINKGFLATGGLNYNLFAQDNQFYSWQFFFKYLGRAWFHFLTEPLPSNIVSLNMLLTYPLMIVWYFILAFCCLGIRNLAVSRKLLQMAPLFIFMSFFISLVGMMVPNIGTVIRIRDTLIPFIAMLASCGLIKPRGTNLFQGG